jgi:hypothetical protein
VRTNKYPGIGLVGTGLVIWFLAGGCSGQNGRGTKSSVVTGSISQVLAGQPVIKFDTVTHDFGTILEGERVLCYFDYENTGDGTLLIQSVEASCGCTIVDWNREPLEPGGEERLQVIFDATGRAGAQFKLVTVRSNATEPGVRLTLKANVKANY